MKRREALRKTAMLSGSAALTPALLNLLQACQKQKRLSWEPQFLSQQQAQLVSALVDTILPKTETPGGLEMKVDMFIDLVFAKLYHQQAQSQVVQELQAMDENCQQKYASDFLHLSHDDKAAFLMELEASSPKFNGSVWGTAVGEQEPVGIYRTLKSLMLWGYFSSEEIGKNVLSYDPIPGDYLGCIPLSDVGNSWSL